MKYKLIIVAMVLVVVLTAGCIETTSNGRHSGQVTAVEQNGLIWKTWTVYVKSDISSSQEDSYCVEDVSLIPVLDSFSKERNKVTLLYRDELIVAPWRCGGYNGGIVTGVEK